MNDPDFEVNNVTPPNPYPDGSWSRITDFGYETPLYLWRGIKAVQRRAGEDADYLVARPYVVTYRLDGATREITVPEGMVTDLSSVPAIARPIISRVGPHLEASIVHDFLYIAWQDLDGRGARAADRRFADHLFRVAMGTAKVGALRRFLIYWAVRLAGRGVYERRDDIRYMREKTEPRQPSGDDPARPGGAED